MARAQVELQCNYCGASFLRDKSEAARKERHFCSRLCAQLIQKRDNGYVPKLSPSDIADILRLYATGAFSSRELSLRFKVCKSTVRNILEGKTFKQTEVPDVIGEIRQLNKGTSNKHTKLKQISFPTLTIDQWDVITGGLLGDAGVTDTCEKDKYDNNSCFVKSQVVRTEEHILWHQDFLKPYSGSGVSRITIRQNKLFCGDYNLFKGKYVATDRTFDASCYTTISHPVFSDLRRHWYKNGVKIVPTDIRLRPLSCAVWYCDDGCLVGGTSITMATNGFTFSDCDVLVAELFRLGVSATIRKHHSNYSGLIQPLICMNRLPAANFIEMVRPHIIWQCFQYKIAHKPLDYRYAKRWKT